MLIMLYKIYYSLNFFKIFVLDFLKPFFSSALMGANSLSFDRTAQTHRWPN